VSGARDTQELRTTQVITTRELRRNLSQATQAPAALVLLVGPAAQIGRQWDLSTNEIFIGRDESSHIQVLDRSVSNNHARITRHNNTDYVEDLGSTNGTLLNQQRLRAGHQAPLRDNDQVMLGSVAFKYLAPGSLEAMQNKIAYLRAALDPLTEIFNKRGLNEQGKEVIKAARDAQLPVTAIVFDIDDFKRINDTHGHQCGDYVLKELASVLKQGVIREGDLFARYGGEEFCLLMASTDLNQGLAIAERLRVAIAGHDFRYGEWTLNVTVSVGVAYLTEDMAGWQDLFEAADLAAYTSKHGGKNKVTAAQD